ARTVALEQCFPFYQEQIPAFDLSRQARLFLGKLKKNELQLARAGISFGQARVAVRASQAGHPGGCIYCGLCMYGCPFGYIYNSADTLRQLESHPSFSYQPGVIVKMVRESKTNAIILGYDRISEQPIEIEAD